MSARPTTSASYLPMRSLCPGSHNAEDGLPEDRSDEADEGRNLHELSADPALDRSKLTDEQLRALDRCAWLESYVLGTVETGAGLQGKEFVEGHEKALVMHSGLRVALTGTCDRWRYYPAAKVLVIMDKKFGRIAVEDAANNLQLRAYAVMGAEEWECAHVFVAILQPRVYLEGPPVISLYDAQAITHARLEILAILAACHAPDAPRIASEAACKYCKAATTCPAHLSQLTTAVPLVHLPAAQLSTEQLTTCLEVISLLTDRWQDEIKAEARRRIVDERLPDFVLKDNAPRRSITDATKAIELLQAAGFSDADILRVANITVDGAMKLYRAKDRTPKEAGKALEIVLHGVLISKPTAPSIKRLAA